MAEQTSDNQIVVGRISAPHGIGGQVLAERLSDNPLRFRAGAVFCLANGKTLTLAAKATMHKGKLLLKFIGVDDRDAAEKLRNQTLSVDEAELPPLPAGCYYQYQLIGLTVREKERVLGRISEVLDYTANDIYVVEKPQGGQLLLPALKSVVLSIDLAAQSMEVRLPEGLE